MPMDLITSRNVVISIAGIVRNTEYKAPMTRAHIKRIPPNSNSEKWYNPRNHETYLYFRHRNTGYIWDIDARALQPHSPSRPKMSLASRFEGNSKVRK